MPAKQRFITELHLERNPDSWADGTVRLEQDQRLTSAAADFVRRRRLTVRKPGPSETAAASTVERLTDKPQRTHVCSLCGQPVHNKGEGLTSLDGSTYVAKNHPRIIFRGEIDLLTAETICLVSSAPECFRPWLLDLRSFIGNILKSEVDQKPLPELRMGPFDGESLRALSHRPELIGGAGHRVPDGTETQFEAGLNRLRAVVRKSEISSYSLDPEDKLGLTRGLNRLSSAVYVFYLFCIALRQGNHVS